LGGFVKVEQVGETYGLADSVFQKIKPMLVLGNNEIRKLPLNSASKENLQQHPYIRWKGAQSIVTYREAHGSIKSIKELLSIPYFTEELFGKLEPYLSIE
jgi:DNA uptake protein ComE-like DNA-binding protein